MTAQDMTVEFQQTGGGKPGSLLLKRGSSTYVATPAHEPPRR
ncbi:hypothetical protein [Stenotrophomonas maltophilia]|nr:hypothetical protein [Stenotrophomonas maltophilia]